MNRYLYALMIVALLLYARSPAMSQAPTNISAIWANDGGDKVTQDELRASANPGAVLNSVWNGQQMELFGARNEVVGAQLILEASTSSATNVTVSLSSLVGPGSSTISSSPASGNGVFDWTNRQIELFYVRYLQIKGLSKLGWGTYDERHVPKAMQRPFTGAGYANSGTGWTDRPNHDKFYPDIAVPLELVPSFTIAAGQNQSIWIDVYIPKTASPGTYLGTISVAENGATTHQIPVQLTVRNFSLPDVPSAKTMLYYDTSNVSLRFFGNAWITPSDPTYGSASVLVRDRYFQLAHRHRISLIDDNETSAGYTGDSPSPEWAPRLDGSLFTAAHGYDGPGVNIGNGVFSVGTFGSWSWNNGTEQDMWNHTNGWASWFAANSPATEYFLYLADEASSSKYPQLETWSEWIHANPGPGQKMKAMATIPLPDASANVPSLDIPNSANGLGQSQTWQPLVDKYTHDPVKRYFMYNGERPMSGSFMMDDDGVSLRELAWGQFKKGIQRWFYWDGAYYNNYQGGMGQTNVFEKAQTFGTDSGFDSVLGESGWNYSNGDGVLFYPGTDTQFPQDSYGVLGPMASLRLKLWRRGIQDADYLTLAAAINPSAVNQIVNSMVPEVFWEYGVSDPNDPTWVRTDISWPTNPDAWESARSQLAKIIESASVPVVSSFSPTSGHVGDQITVTGSNFSGTTGVSFNGVGANYSVVSQTTITASVPPGASTGPISVTNAVGTGTSASNFTVPAPTINSFSPTQGSISSSVVLTGSGFSGATGVKINNADCVYTVNSDTQITVIIPSAATTGPISVTTPAGTGTSATSFTVVGPTISGLSPNNGSLRSQVVIAGSGLTSASSVTFNGAAANYYVNNDNQIVAFVPDTATSGPVTVTTPSGTSPGVNFTVNPPVITGFSPTHGSIGSSVTISGSGFTLASAVKFGGVSASFFISTDTSINATVPAGFVSGTISVTGPVGTGTTAGTFTVDAPAITGFSPTHGAAGTNVTVNGSGFTGATSIQFNGVAANLFVSNDGQITTTVPTGATTGPITVTGPGGTATSATNFAVP